MIMWLCTVLTVPVTVTVIVTRALSLPVAAFGQRTPIRLHYHMIAYSTSTDTSASSTHQGSRDR